MRIALPLLLLAAVAAGWFLFADDDGDATDSALTADLDDGSTDLEDAAYLQGTGREGAGTTPGTGEGAGSEADNAPRAPAPVVWLTGRVLSVKTGAPIAGATIYLEPQRTPCPRPLHSPALQQGAPSTREGTLTKADGTFTVHHPAGVKPPRADVFALAPGYVGAMVCGAGREALVIRLSPARQIRGRVEDSLGRPVPGVALATLPPEGVMPTLANTVTAQSGEQGDFVIDGLGGEPIQIGAAHPEFMLWRGGPYDPKTDAPVVIQLTPAWRLALVLRTDDGIAPKNPTVSWITDGDEPRGKLELLRLRPQAADDLDPPTGELRIPCDRGLVTLEVGADGYVPWRTEGEPIPPEGGEHTFDVFLGRDRTQGKVRIKLEDSDGNAVSYLAAGGRVVPVWLGSTAGPTGYVLEPGEVLTLPGLPAGPYRFIVYTRQAAPATVEVEVVGGEVRDAVARLSAPAKLLVKFTAPRAGLVRFRVLQNGRAVHAFPVDAEHAEGKPEHAGAPPPLLTEGTATGLLLSGLSEGEATVVVDDEVFEAAPRSVTLSADEPAEVEITLTEKDG